MDAHELRQTAENLTKGFAAILGHLDTAIGHANKKHIGIFGITRDRTRRRHQKYPQVSTKSNRKTAME